MNTPTFADRLQNAWNAFTGKDRYAKEYRPYSYISSYRPDRQRLTRGNERSIAAAIYNRIALDVAALDFNHVRLDENNRFSETMRSGLNECISVRANRDQTAREFIKDCVISLFDEGAIAIVPTHTSINPNVTGSFDILEMRVCKILDWMPKDVRVRAYNEDTGNYEDIVMSKNAVAIVENPFYSVMNEKSSIMSRLIQKLNLLDNIDKKIGSDKLDLIVSLPYTVKTQSRMEAAEKRRKDIEMQLAESNYGVAYVDGTEKITQLNRSIENNMLGQVKYLTELAYGQLAITTSIMDGTADERTMRNYYSRTVQVVALAITESMYTKFLTKTARSQGQSIMFFNDPFKLVPVDNLAELADKLTRNEIMTSNEIRQIIGLKPSSDPEADELRNKNLNKSSEEYVDDQQQYDEEVDTSV